ncbi:MAG TPA: hypothetical protein VFP77_05205 [Gemmatimonadaceae bacterium]|nr:hypothetical protein [Gemmatimonadaceae bacterium]
MRASPIHLALLLASVGISASTVDAQALASPTAEMHWRHIGPFRAGRGRAIAGVPSQPNTFYISFDNGGVWRSTDFGSNWFPLFDDQPTGSIGAIAVAPSNPNIIYVGSGAGIIRPDLATGDGIYKSTDAGKTWTHLGLRDSQMIAYIDVDPTNPDRLFVAALGHPYGPSEERGIFRSTDGGKTFQKVLYKDAYTSGNDVRIDPANPSTVYAVLWQQQQGFIEGQGFGGAANGVFKSTDGGNTWTQLTNGMPGVIQANIAIAPSNTRVLYALAATATPTNSVTGVVNLYKTMDGGEHWAPVISDSARSMDQRPLARIGGGDLPTVTVDPKNENVIYSASVVMWRSDNGGVTWSPVRGSPGGDDYQRIWINPNNTDIILAVSDQGAVVSANHGTTWSNWYTQPTAAMYHVSTDNTFAYRVCGGQQDSGSACVDSRSPDGMITFHDWHPVNIQEYGIAAPDPKDPDLVYGSARTNVSLYNRRTSQTTAVGPDMSAKGPNGESYNRNVRTMPINWSPLDPNTLYYVSNAVWKTTDGGKAWTRISPDLARQTWAVPANAGKYASTVTPAPLGTITALSPSPKNINVIWAGTDDGNIQVTTDGGAKWSNVTPPQIKPWTRIFNIEAGHFDTNTAYAAANTMRIDDMNPHLWRTHDGGRTWTEINTGITPGAVTNSIREDPRVKGLLYASTDTQVWVSYDDGDHWQSLRINMPAISVRDLQLKDDSACLCSDLIAGTHGRGFWILDDVTPLRAIATAGNARSSSYLVKPATAVRVRFAENDPTPWPPEIPAGENPPAGAVVDYFLAANAGEVSLQFVDAGGKVIRTYSSTDTISGPDPALNPEEYTRICQRNTGAPHCSVPLYWAAPNAALASRSGMHHFIWDMRYDPIAGTNLSEGGAVPHRTYLVPNTPWAPPGSYTVRLVVDGKTYTQPLRLVLDPRVKTPTSAIAQVSALSREMYDGAVTLRAAYVTARAMADRLTSAGDAALKAQIDSIAPPQTPGARRGFGFRQAPSGPPTLESVQTAMMAAAMSMQSADVAPTARELDAVARARAQYNQVMARWRTLAAARSPR